MATPHTDTNFIRLPNDLMDYLMSIKDMNLSELKVTMFIIRKTIGWGKDEDRISIKQFTDGTKLCRQAVIEGIEAGMRRGTITKRPDGQWFLYSIKGVYSVDQSTDHTSLQNRPEGVYSVDRFEQKGVYSVDQQKKDLKDKKEIHEGGDKSPTPPDVPNVEKVRRPRDPNQNHDACKIYYELTGYRPNKTQAAQLADQISDMSRWRNNVTYWLSCGHRLQNINGMIDWYGRDKYTRDHSNGRVEQGHQGKGGSVVQYAANGRNGHLSNASPYHSSRPVSEYQAEQQRRDLAELLGDGAGDG